MNFFGKAKNILSVLLDYIFPRTCVVCNKTVNLDGFCNLCASCVSKISWLSGPRCQFCSRPMGTADGDQLADALTCSDCKKDPPNFRSGLGCWLHRGVGRALVLALKYRNSDFLINDLANLFQLHVPAVAEFVNNSVLVPVPVHYFRRVRRGYNQAEVIAKAVVKVANNTGIEDILKSKNKKSQTKLRRDERLLNVKNMFTCSPRADDISKDARIVLVDDVLTTGTTIKECCNVLRAKGFYDLHVLTLSCG